MTPSTAEFTASTTGSLSWADTTVFPATAAAVRRARRLVVRELTCLGYTPDHELCQNAELLTGELCTNAVRHGRVAGRGFGLRLMRLADSVRIEVADARHAVLPRHPPTVLPGSESGRGLTLVAALSDRWGVRQEALGKSVWFELDTGS